MQGERERGKAISSSLSLSQPTKIPKAAMNGQSSVKMTWQSVAAIERQSKTAMPGYLTRYSMAKRTRQPMTAMTTHWAWFPTKSTPRSLPPALPYHHEYRSWWYQKARGDTFCYWTRTRNEKWVFKKIVIPPLCPAFLLNCTSTLLRNRHLKFPARKPVENVLEGKQTYTHTHIYTFMCMRGGNNKR